MTKTPEDLKKKIEAAKAGSNNNAENDEASDSAVVSASGARMAMRAATDMVAALVVGGALGYGLDNWLGTKPWFMITMFFLGAIAGFINIYRSQTGQDYQVGLGNINKKPIEEEKKHGGKNAD